MNLLEAPPGILDFVLSKPSSDDDRQEQAFDLRPGLWGQLPEHLLHLVLARLPFQSLLRFRSVCTQWKASFASPTFHHVPSHRAHIPPWIFFIGNSSAFRRIGERVAKIHEMPYDNGRDDDGYVFEGDEESGDVHQCDTLTRDDHGDVHGVTMSGDHGNIDGADGRDDEQTNHLEEPQELLSFDCESDSWRPPLCIPPGFESPQNLDRYSVCSFEQHVLITTCTPKSPLFLFNPALASCKELPRRIYSRKLAGLALSVERVVLSGSGTSMSLGDLSSSKQDSNVDQFAYATTLHVVVAEEITPRGGYVVQSFNSSTGSWCVSGYLLPSRENIFMQRQMVFCEGSFYAKVSGGILKLDKVLGGPEMMECDLIEFPIPPNENDDRFLSLLDSRLVATKDGVFLVGVTDSHSRDVMIWQFLPHAPKDACWQVIAYTPISILEDFYGGFRIANLDCLAHGDLILFQIANRKRFLMYDVTQKLWRFSPKSKCYLESMTFVWEPLLKN